MVKIDGNDVIDWTYDQLDAAIIGPYGTPILVTVKQRGAKALVDIPLGNDSRIEVW